MITNPFRAAASRFSVRVLLAIAAALALIVARRHASHPIVHANPTTIADENRLKPGATDWDISAAGDPDIQGFATDISVNVGETVHFKILAPGATAGYRIDIYRLGYYGGAGATLVATTAPTAPMPQTQPACLSQLATTGLIDCGNWAESGTWDVPATSVSGIYIAKLTRHDNGHHSHIVFIVRDDSRDADIVFQTSDTTWQAYNQYPGVTNGGASLYCGGPLSNDGSSYARSCGTRAAKVSYNRPFDTRAHDPQSWLFNAEYPMVRWLEANGYDVKYQSGVDTDRRGFDLTGAHRPKVFLSVGHDEYWSGNQRQTVENARNAGVSLAFFSGNEMYWKTRYETSVDGLAVPYRTLVTYKETIASAKIDPAIDPITHLPIWTGTWRDPRFAATTDGGRPENGVIGQIFTINCCSDRIKIPQEMGIMRLWAHTGVSAVAPGDFYRTPEETLGYEWDEDLDNGSRPAGLIRLSSTTLDEPEKLTDFGANVAPGRATHSLTMYRHNSGAIVFGAGTVQWSWGLDGNHDRGVTPTSHNTDQAMQQATVNLLADMGAQPATLQVGDPNNPRIFAATKSTDLNAPVSTIVSPAAGSTVSSGVRLTITGTSADQGGGIVAGVEVSVDGGTTWKAARGTTLWSFDWTPGVPGSATIKVRAIDDSGNLEAAGAGATVSIEQGDCPCTSIWRPTAVPTVPSAADTNAVELGVLFKSDIDGFITGVRFYKGVMNTGTHVGSLWSESGIPLANAEFQGETASGWQQVSFGTPVAITANTVYVASYHTNVGSYSADGGYFATTGVDSPPLHALQSTANRPNGRFSYGPSQFPMNSFNGTNYWVDVVFAPSLSDTTPPQISAVKATTIDSARVALSWTTDEPATSRIDYGTDPALLTASIANLPPNTITVTDNNFVTQHATPLAGLRPNTTYYYLITAVDHSGNATTVAAPTFTVPGPTLRDTAASDFEAGASAGGTYVSQTGDGELMLAPTSATEFTGPSLSPGWVEVPWSPEGYSILVNGVLLVDGARIAACVLDANGNCLPETTDQTPSAVFTAPHTLEFTANFSGDRFQHAGLGASFASTTEPWAIFSTLNGGLLFARTNTGAGAVIDTGLGTGLLGAFHHYKIDWKTDGIDYYVDGALVASHPLAIAGGMRPVAASDFNPFGGTIFVDWMRMSPYASTGTFYSRIFDAEAPVDWNSIQWTTTTPPGTSVSIAVRTGNTSVPDATWSDFSPMTSGGPIALNSQFIQYRAVLTSSKPDLTPQLEDIIISTGHAPVANADSAIVPANGSHTFAASGPGSLTANDTDADAGDVLRVVGVTAATHGSVALNADGSVKYTPVATYSGPDAFIYTVSDGLLTAAAAVTLDVRFGNIAPVAQNDFYTIDEDTTLSVPAAIGVLVNDSDAEHDPLSAVLTSFPQHGLLTLAANGGFTYTPTANYAGPDSFRYKANDGAADSNEATVTLTINQVNDPPVTVDDSYIAVLNQPLDVPAAFSPSLGRFVSGVLANDHDVEVGDTAPMHAQIVSNPAHGQLVMAADGGFSYTPQADFLGADSFTYRAVDHFNAQGNVATVTIIAAIKAVTANAAAGATVATGGDSVDPGDPLHSAVTSPTAATVLIAQGVIANSHAPSGFTYLNQQVNISVLNADGSDVTAAASAPIRIVFNIDRSLVPPAQDEHTLEMFRNGVKIPDCLGQTSIPAANVDPCIAGREGGAALDQDVRLTILTSHASTWNIGLSSDALGDAPVGIADGPYPVDFGAPIVVAAPGVLANDIGRSSLTARLVGTPANGTVNLTPSGAFTFTPNPEACGAASFTYLANDGTADSAPTLVSIVIDCKPRPSDDAATVLEDSGINTITVLGNDTDPDPGQTLTVSAVTQPASGVSAVAVSGGAVTYRPNADFFGSDSFTYTVSDGRGGKATATVSVTVKPVNDAPRFTAGANVTVLEDAATQTAAGWATGISAGPANESAQAINFIATNSNTTLFSIQPAVLADGTLTFTPAPNANGSATVSVQAHDDGGSADGGVDTSAAQTFTITVTPVNDAPSFTKGADQIRAGIAGAQTVPNWATSISAGPADEAGQTLNFVVTADNPALFAAQPAVSPAGTLSFTPANVEGSSAVTVALHDNGGTANGGADTSPAQTFTIAINKAATTTMVSSALNPSQYGDLVTFTATVSVVAPGTGAPSGSVTFMDGAASLGSFSLDGSGHATLTTSALGAGSHSISAVYAGAALFGGSTSAVVAQSVGPRAASVTPNAASKIYGAADPGFTGTVTGFLASDNVMATYSRTVGETVNGSPYTITASLSPAGVLSNYAITSNTAPFTITSAALTIKADDNTRVYGAPNPPLTVTYTGFVNGDTAASLTTQPTVTTTATSTSAVGTYPITPSGAVSGNYGVTYANGTLTVTAAQSTTTVTSSSNPGLKGVPITLTATVTPVSPSTGTPTGTVTFRDGTTVLGTGTLAAGMATITAEALAPGTHAITAAYGGSPAFGTSTGSLSQVVNTSATLTINFTGHAIADDTKKPKVVDTAIDNSPVRVFLKGDSCAYGYIATGQPRIWGPVYENCTPMAFGSYQTTGTTDASGNLTIIVPPTATKPNSDFIVIGKAIAQMTDGSSQPIYSEHTVNVINAGESKRVLLHQIRTFNGKVVPGRDIEEFGSYLGIVQPDYLDWTENQEQYPLVLVAEGDWSLTTGVTPPNGFVPDASEMAAQIADSTGAIQFTMTDVGSDWTETVVNHSITHLGTLRQRNDTIPMTDKKVTTAKNDSFKVMHDSAATALNVMLNDKVNHIYKPITITAITPALNGTVAVADDRLSVSYTPNPGYSGVDTFTYTITDLVGGTSTGTVTVTVLATPTISVRNTTAIEGNSGQSPATINVVLSNQSLDTVKVNYTTADGSATAGADYVASSGTVTFLPGDTSEPITVPIIGDTLAEPNEHFTIVLSSPANATIAAAPGGDVTIVDDDPPEVSIAPTASIVEGNAGTNNVAVAVTLSQTHDESVWVTYKTSDGTATAGSDYISTTGTLQFYPGTKTQNIYIPVYGDTIGEATEYFYVDLSNPVNATLTSASRATITIVDDDSSTKVFGTTADFAAGTLGAGMYLSETVDGEITLAPSQAAEFSGASLPAGWSPSVLAAGGGAAVSGGKLTIDGAALVAATGPVGTTLEFVATFNTSNQNIGFGTSGALVSPMAMFTIRANNLYAKTINGTKSFETLMAGIDWRGKSHRFQITTTAQNASYYIDGTLMISHTSMAWGTAAMAPVIIDSTVADGAIVVDWIRVTPFAASGSYTSQVFDAGAAVTWTKLASSNTMVPFFTCCSTTGTTNVITYRTGNTPTPDASWTPFTALGTAGAMTGSSRYMQFMVQMTTTNAAKAPVVQDVTVTYKR